MHTLATYKFNTPVLVLGREGSYYKVRDPHAVILGRVYEADLSNLRQVKEIPEALLTLTERRVLLARRGKMLSRGIVKALCAREKCRKLFHKKTLQHRFCCRKCQYTAPKEEGWSKTTTSKG